MENFGKQSKILLKNWKTKMNQIFSSKMAEIGKNGQNLVKTGKFSKKWVKISKNKVKIGKIR